MAIQFRLWENGHHVTLLPAAADAGGRTGIWFDAMFAHKVYLLCTVNQGNAAPVTFTPLQATSLTGANSKGLSEAVPIATNLATQAADLLTIQPNALSFTTDAGIADKTVIFELLPQSAFDVNNITVGGYRFFGVSTSASNAANITACTALLLPLRFGNAQTLTAEI